VRVAKGNKARVVPLNSSARTALADYLAERWNLDSSLKAVITHLPTVSPVTPLWASQKGGALHVRPLTGMFSDLVKRCAARSLVPDDTSPHTLRHTFATNYLKDHPGDLVGLAILLGHSTLETTRIYVQPSADDLAARLEKTRLNAYE
jgi:site-specific recombinase XerD